MAAIREQQRGRRQAGEPNVAAVLTWFVPGAGHLYLGRPVAAACAAAVVIGLYGLGLRLSHGMGFEYLQPELRSALAPALAPETGFLGGFFYQLQKFGYGPGYMRPWPEWMKLGTTLTALAGILNTLLMVQAHTLARLAPGASLGRRSPEWACLATWAVPGLGHWLQGRRLRATLVFLVLVGLFAVGCALAEGTNLDRERHFYYWSGQFLVGLPAIVAEWVHGHPVLDHHVPYAEAGLVYGCLAGLLNVLAMIDVYGFAERSCFRGKEVEGEERSAAAPVGAGAQAEEGVS